MFYDNDADTRTLENKTITIIGFGSQAEAQGACLRDSGVKVIIGAREEGSGWRKARNQGFPVFPIPEAVKKGDIVHILIPDEHHGEVYKKQIAPFLKPGTTLSFSHGFSVLYGEILPPPEGDVILVAPKSPATEERKAFLAGSGVPGLIGIHRDWSGKARETALGLAKAMGFTRAGVMEATFKEETVEDLFGEQNVLCGGLVHLLKAGFEVLTEGGYPPEMAYFETVHELKLIVDLIFEGGLERLTDVISNTAEWGMYATGPRIITEEVKEEMRRSLVEIEEGRFARGWLKEFKEGSVLFKSRRQELLAHPLEETGKKVRKMMKL